VTEGAPYQKIKAVEFNPGSRQHIARCLILQYGWQPTEFTPSGQPELNEKTLKGLEAPIAPALMEFLLVEKRLGQLFSGKEAWLKHMTADRALGGRITGMIHVHHEVKQCGAVTHRASHIKPNLAQVPKVGNPYGEECRELYTVPPGWVQVGVDASGLELRCLAHYMAKWDDMAYGRVILEGKNEDGTDIHSVNRDALGLVGKPGRDRAKTFIYAFLYGSGDLNLGWLIGYSDEDMARYRKKKAAWQRAGAQLQRRKIAATAHNIASLMKGAELRKNFLKNLPALKSLVDNVAGKVTKPGYLKMPDGRRTYIRHAHAALNSLLQAAGAIICKLWIARYADKLTARFGPQGWNGQWAALGWIHDEVQIACRPEIAEELGQILVETIREVGIELGWRCPLDGEAKVGGNWKETH
jgi:DNA polymerase I-like protein with 3'-5' exonuclease and polymerase domains